MIDLNYHRCKKDKKEEDVPVGLQILILFPFALFFWFILTQAFLHGIY